MSDAREITVEDPDMLYHQVIVNTHIKRFRETYKDFFELAETVRLVEYFFNKVYNLQSKMERDELIVESFSRFKPLISEKSRIRLEKLIELNSLTDRLDKQMADHYLEKFPKPKSFSATISAARMKQCYAQANKKEERLKQLDMLLDSLESFFELSKYSLVEMLLKPAYLAAVMVNAKSLYILFEEGYLASKPVSRKTFQTFLKTVKEKETAYLESVYGKKKSVTKKSKPENPLKTKN